MKISTFLLLIFISGALVFAGCSGSPQVKPAPEVKTPPPPPPPPSQPFWTSHPERQPWITNEPEVIDGNLCFVGLSDKFAMEKDARENAQRDAAKKVTNFISTKVTNKFERLITSYGLSSGVVDATKAARDFEQQFSEAVFSRLKVKEWYIEKWDQSNPYYLVFCLAYVPQTEVDRVIAENEKRQQEILNAAKSANEQLVQASELMIQADSQSSGQPVQSVAKYQEAIKKAETAKAYLKGFPELAGMIPAADEVSQTAVKKINERIQNPEFRFMAAVYSLAKNAKKPLTVAVAGANYQDTKASSEFANYLVPKIESVMSQEAGLYRVISQKVFQDELKKQPCSVEDCLAGKLTPATQTVVSSLEGMLYVRYWERASDIEIKFELLEVGKGMVLGSTSVELPKYEFPGIAIKPSNEPIISQGLKAFKLDPVLAGSDFKVTVWPDKGEGALYKEGEIMSFHFKANKNCYVYLYHMDAGGQMQFLFPNGYHKDNFVNANQVYTIPDENMNFNFEASGPFGTEIVKAIASYQPIKDFDIDPEQVGFRGIGNIKDESTQQTLTRGIQAVPKEARAEALCTITTISKSE